MSARSSAAIAGREAGERPAGGAHLVDVDAGPARRAARVSASTSLTISADQVADQLGHQPRLVDIGIARPHLGPAARDQRHVEQFLEREQPGAQPVVDVVIVVGDVVGDRRDLRLQARPARQIEREFRIGLGQRPGRRPATGPLCLASPSSVSQLRLSPAKRG